jgi:hypothetical protein
MGQAAQMRRSDTGLGFVAHGAYGCDVKAAELSTPSVLTE